MTETINQLLNGAYHYQKRVFISEDRNKSLLLEKISIEGKPVICVTPQVWNGTWYSEAPIICRTADDVIRKFKLRRHAA